MAADRVVAVGERPFGPGSALTTTLGRRDVLLREQEVAEPPGPGNNVLALPPRRPLEGANRAATRLPTRHAALPVDFASYTVMSR